MPIEKEFNYANEADFTSHFLVPLLRRLGFLIVAEYHNTVAEFGKDLVFGEIDRFGQLVYHGLQAKYTDSIGQTDSHDLVNDCNEAFTHPFHHPTTGQDEHIATFYVANAGSISTNARTNFFSALRVPHGGHVHMLDGKTLLALDRWGTVNRIDSVRERLSGFLIELRYNRNQVASIGEMVRNYSHDTKNPLPIQRLRVAAASYYLQSPLLPSQIDTDTVLQYWDCAENLLNNVLDTIMGNRPKENKQCLARQVLCNVSDLERIGQSLEVAVETILANLGPLTAP